MLNRYPKYAVFGNGYDLWTVDLLFGGGTIQTMREFHAQDVLKVSKDQSLRFEHAYLKAKDLAIKYFESVKDSV